MAVYRGVWCQLFLSAEGDVRVALDHGVAAATLVSNATAATEDDQRDSLC